MTNQYLDREVGRPLTLCLQELVQVRPRDPIEWMALWLYKYMDNQLYYMEKMNFYKNLHDVSMDHLLEEQARKARRECLEKQLQKYGLLAKRLMTPETKKVESPSIRESPELEQEQSVRESPIQVEEIIEQVEPVKQSDKSSLESSETGSDSSHIRPRKAKWKLTCPCVLICEHPALGALQSVSHCARVLYSESPGWWEEKEHIEEALYDHEIYSRANDDTIDDWDSMEHLTLEDFCPKVPKNKARLPHGQVDSDGIPESLEELAEDRTSPQMRGSK